jgi:hypothetical protein
MLSSSAFESNEQILWRSETVLHHSLCSAKDAVSRKSVKWVKIARCWTVVAVPGRQNLNWLRCWRLHDMPWLARPLTWIMKAQGSVEGDQQSMWYDDGLRVRLLQAPWTVMRWWTRINGKSSASPDCRDLREQVMQHSCDKRGRLCGYSRNGGQREKMKIDCADASHWNQRYDVKLL